MDKTILLSEGTVAVSSLRSFGGAGRSSVESCGSTFGRSHVGGESACCAFVFLPDRFDLEPDVELTLNSCSMMTCGTNIDASIESCLWPRGF